MSLTLDRIEIESAGSDPVRLATALLGQLPGLDGRVPVREIALALDIDEIREAPLSSIEACLQTDPMKSRGQIVLNARSSDRRRRFSIAHELGHFLNERHAPVSAGRFNCSRDDMSAPSGDPQHIRQELEANSFAIEVLAPRGLLAPHLKPPADLGHVLGIVDRFDISRHAAARRYIALHRECLALVFTQDGVVRYIEKSERFPYLTFWIGADLGRRLPETSSDEGRLTDLGDVDPADWLSWPGPHDLFAQTLVQDEGYATTLLLAEPGAEYAEREPPRFRR